VSGRPDHRFFMVEHDLRGFSSWQRASARYGEAVGRAVRQPHPHPHSRILVPEESRCLCLFEAADAGLVRNVNDVAHFPPARVVLARVVAVRSTPASCRLAVSAANRRGGHIR
jgi:hypothetical protein